MRHAPALTLALKADPLWRGGLRAVGLAGLVVVLGWLAWHGLHQSLPGKPMLAVAVLSTVPSLYLLKRSGTAPSPATLCWLPAQGLWLLRPSTPDGGRPHPPGRLGRLDCMLSSQHWLLLRHGGPHRPTTWIPISRRAHQADWHALCCAVFSPGTSPSPPPLQADE